MTLVTRVISKGREFYILKNAQGFWGVESNKFSDGVLQEPISGLQGFLSQKVSETIKMVLQAIEVDHLETMGMDRFDAVLKVFAERK